MDRMSPMTVTTQRSSLLNVQQCYGEKNTVSD